MNGGENAFLRDLQKAPLQPDRRAGGKKQVEHERQQQKKAKRLDGLEQMLWRKPGQLRGKQQIRQRDQIPQRARHTKDDGNIQDGQDDLCTRVQPVNDGIARHILSKRDIP